MNQQQLDVIETIKQYMPNLINGILQVIDKINKNKLKDSLQTMPDIIEGFQWVNEALMLILKEQIPFMDEAKINDLFAAILKCYEDEDSILAKDLLKYELLPLIENLQEVLERI